MPRTKTVVMGGQEYEVTQLPMRDNKDFRNKLTEPVNKIITLMQNYRVIEINSVADITGLIVIVKDVVFGSMDTLLECLFTYAPALAADRERIEGEAFDDEAIAALTAIADLVYPFGQLVTAWGGRSETQTSTNSALQNGVVGTKKPLARQKNT